jgi:hypothetical protein
MTYFVYGLYDSGEPNECRWVGATSRMTRPLEHTKRARHARSDESTRPWVKTVLAEGRHIIWRILEALDSMDEAYQAENRIISELRIAGHRLLNNASGGAGAPGISQETRDRKSVSMRATCAIPSVRERKSRGAKRAWRPDMLDSTRTPEASARRIAAVAEAMRRPEVSAKKSSALTGKPWTAAHRAAHLAGQKKRRAAERASK